MLPGAISLEFYQYVGNVCDLMTKWNVSCMSEDVRNPVVKILGISSFMHQNGGAMPAEETKI